MHARAHDDARELHIWRSAESGVEFLPRVIPPSLGSIFCVFVIAGATSTKPLFSSFSLSLSSASAFAIFCRPPFFFFQMN